MLSNNMFISAIYIAVESFLHWSLGRFSAIASNQQSPFPHKGRLNNSWVDPNNPTLACHSSLS